MSPSHRQLSLAISLALFTSCSSQPVALLPDARTTSVPDSPAGTFAIVSKLGLQMPSIASAVLDPLTASTDGADDPTRYLVDHMIAALPEGTLKSFAQQVAPFVASYLNRRLVEIAPHFVAGIEAIARGAVHVATRFDLTESLTIDVTGDAVRTITGVRFDVGAAPKTMTFAEVGLPDITVNTRVAFSPEARLTFADHSHRLPFGALLRAGLDRIVIPSVEPTAHDLATALGLLVDCPRIGELVSTQVGLGSPTLYRAACRAGMNEIANDLYRRIDIVTATAFDLRLTGTAEGVDLDADGTMDDIRTGTWSGTLDYAGSTDPLVSATFTGTKR